MSSAEVADKAVSTEDLEHAADETTKSTALELVRLEEVLSALVESKVVAIKAGHKKGRGRSHSSADHHHHHHHRLASTSTASSSHNHHHHHHHKRQSDSALLASKKHHRQQRETAFCGSPPASCSYSSPHHEGYHNYTYHHHHAVASSSCCSSPTPSHSKMLSGADYVSLSIEGEEEVVAAAPARKKRKKRKRRRLGAAAAGTDEGRPKKLLVEAEDLPQRARWTIIATACLLLLMSILLVGVTLRMAPIIDEMVRKENEEYLNSISREGTLNNVLNGSASSPPLDLSSTPQP